MKLRRAEWEYTNPQIRTLILASASIVALAVVAAAKLGVSGVKQVGPVIVAQAEGNATRAAGRCKVSGCSREVCADEDVITPCIWNPAYGCYKKALCEVQSDGKCGWTMTAELEACLRNLKGSLTGKSKAWGSPPN